MKKQTLNHSRSALIKSRKEVADKIDEYIRKGEHISHNFTEKEFDSWKSYMSEFLKQAFDNPNSEYKYSFINAGVPLFFTDRTDFYQVTMDELDAKILNLKNLKLKLELLPCSSEDKENEKDVKYNSPKVFIVHGHDTALKVTVARTLEKIDLEPVILHEQENNGKTIIEKFESNAETCGFAIILLTADDWGYTKEENDASKRPRARQNVVFEMGFFMGKLGRDRVFLLLDNGVEKPGDLDGIIYNSTNDEMWKIKLVKELKSSGYNVDANKIL